MATSKSYKEVLEYAIEREQEAQRVYLEAAEQFKGKAMRDALLEMAEQERRHEEKLRQLDVPRFLEDARKPVPSLDIAEYAVPGDFRAGMTYPELLTLAMQREKAAFRLYTDLAKVAPDDAARVMFKALAQEEARHKLALEIEYDTHVFQEN
ncbi:MAG TPA: ferritin family protein [Polyangia bacterium]|jgi:rubrerythrin